MCRHLCQAFLPAVIYTVAAFASLAGSTAAGEKGCFQLDHFEEGRDCPVTGERVLCACQRATGARPKWVPQTQNCKEFSGGRTIPCRAPSGCMGMYYQPSEGDAQCDVVRVDYSFKCTIEKASSFELLCLDA